jgi:hypothetical protein
MDVNDTLRSKMSAACLSFTPGWANLIDDKKPDGRFSQLNMRWRAGIPCADVIGDEKWFGGCYMAWVRIALTVTPDGAPYPVQDSSAIVNLCSAAGYVVITDQRVYGLLLRGKLLAQPIGDTNKIVFSLLLSEVVHAETAFKKGAIGGQKASGVTLQYVGANSGAMVIEPTRGISSPWKPEERKMWGRNVVPSIQEAILKVLPAELHFAVR